MQRLNYCRQMVKHARAVLDIPSMQAQHGLWRHMVDLAGASQKFLLPTGGKLLDDDALRALEKDEELRLPYPFVALEFSEDPCWTARQSSCPKRIAFAREDESSIIVNAVYCVRASGAWIALPPVAIPKSGWFDGYSEAGIARFKTRQTAESAQLRQSDYAEELQAVISFLNALSCSNVRAVRSGLGETRRAMSKKGALPFDEYHVLTIDVAGRPCGDSRGEHDGQHRSPREHLRRGHIRRYESGIKVWVNATIVNPGIGGKITKDYRLAASNV